MCAHCITDATAFSSPFSCLMHPKSGIDRRELCAPSIAESRERIDTLPSIMSPLVCLPMLMIVRRSRWYAASSASRSWNAMVSASRTLPWRIFSHVSSAQWQKWSATASISARRSSFRSMP